MLCSRAVGLLTSRYASRVISALAMRVELIDRDDKSVPIGEFIETYLNYMHEPTLSSGNRWGVASAARGASCGR